MNPVKASWKVSCYGLRLLLPARCSCGNFQYFAFTLINLKPTSRFAQVLLGACKASLTCLFVSCAELVSFRESIWPLTLSLCAQVRIFKFAMKRDSVWLSYRTTSRVINQKHYQHQLHEGIPVTGLSNYVVKNNTSLPRTTLTQSITQQIRKRQTRERLPVFPYLCLFSVSNITSAGHSFLFIGKYEKGQFLFELLLSKKTIPHFLSF